jgi:hypothetical protein
MEALNRITRRGSHRGKGPSWRPFRPRASRISTHIDKTGTYTKGAIVNFLIDIRALIQRNNTSTGHAMSIRSSYL